MPSFDALPDPLMLPLGQTLLLQLRAGDELFCSQGSATLQHRVMEVPLRQTLCTGQAWRCADTGQVQVQLSPGARVVLQPAGAPKATHSAQRRSPRPFGALRRWWLDGSRWFRRVQPAASWRTP